MPIKRSKDIRKTHLQLLKLKNSLPRAVGTIAENTFKRNFNAQGFIDITLEKWKGRSRADKNPKKRNILVSSERLKGSIRRISTTSGRVVVGTDVPYAKIHNEGGRVIANQRVRTHTRRTRGGTSVVTAHNRTMNFMMPKRKFIGESRAILIQADRLISRNLKQILG